MKNIAVVTGASGGLGKEFVKLLLNYSDIDEIYALARSGEKLNNLKAEYGKKIKPYIIDLSCINKIKAFGEYLKSNGVNIKFLINNAGYGKFGDYNDLSVDESVNMIDLNISAVVAMGLTCIPYMGKDSHIINIASQAGFQPLPYMNIYASTKAFVKNYSRGLNVELKDRGITVTAVCPGWIKTDFYKRADIGAKKNITDFSFMTTPERVAKQALKDVQRGKDISVCGIYVNICRFLTKIFPEKLVMTVWIFMQKLR